LSIKGSTGSPQVEHEKGEEMDNKKSLSRADFLRGAALAGAGLVAASCATPVPTAAPTAAPTTAAPTAAPTGVPTLVGPTKDKIVVGMARPLSGPLAIIGDSAFKPIYDTWVPRVNDAGGVMVEEYGGKLPIELLIYDDASDVATMTRLTEKLILEDKVDFLWPACGTSFVFAQAPIANKYEYVLITAEGGATTIKDMLPSLPYSFVNLSFSDYYQLPVFADIMSKAGAKTAYIATMADLFGIEYSGVAAIEFPKKGINIVGVKSMPPDIADLSPIITDAKASGADIFFLAGYPGQVMPATGASIELGYNPKAWLGGPGVNFGFYHTGFGPMVEGVCGFTCFARGMTPELDELADILYTDKPEDITDWWGHPFYWAGLDMWKAAIEAAGTLDQKVIKDVLTNEHLTTVLGDTWYENGLLALGCHKGEIGQWVNGVFESVGPEPWTTADLVYPKPAFGA
jgi:ABC-type branched-subunit amino acid transport system substrate-binding protein